MHEAIVAYRVMQLQCRDFNTIMGLLVAVTKFVLIIFSVTCAYAAIRFDGLIGTALGLAGGSNTMLLLFALTFYAGISVDSSDFLGSLKALTPLCTEAWNRKLIRKTLPSMQVMNVRILSFYSIDRLSPLVAIPLPSSVIENLTVD